MLNLIILFLLSKAQNYIFMSSLYEQKNNQKPSKLSSKEFERSVYWSEHKTKAKIKTQQMSIDIS